MKKLAIIGFGLSGRILNFLIADFQQKSRTSALQVEIFDAGNLFPPCGISSTAVAAVRCSPKRSTVLAEQQRKGFAAAEDFLKKYQRPGMEKILIHHIADEKGEEEWQRKWGHLPLTHFLEQKSFVEPAILFYPETFFESLNLKTPLQQTVVQSIVVEQEKWWIKDHQKSYGPYDLLVRTMGAYASFFPSPKQSYKEALLTQKAKAGSYLQWQNVNLDQASFNLAYGDFNLIYRAQTQELLMGSAGSDLEWANAVDYLALTKIYHQFQSFITLPPLSAAQSLQGQRPVGPKRMPWWGEIAPGFYGIEGLYKNGYTLSFLAAKELLGELMKKV